MFQQASFARVFQYWVPGSRQIRGYEVSSLFLANNQSHWSTFIDLPARQRQHFISGELRECAGNSLGFRRFKKTVVLNNGDVACWNASHDTVLTWSFSFRAVKLNGHIPIPPKPDLFYSLHSLVFDTFIGNLFLASGKAVYFLPTISIPGLPENVGPEQSPINFGYYRLKRQEPPPEVQELAHNYLKGLPKTSVMWLQIHIAKTENNENEKFDTEDPVWQLYELRPDGANLLFCYVPQHPSCYSLISSMFP